MPTTIPPQPLKKQEILKAELQNILDCRKVIEPSTTENEIKDSLSALCLSGGGIRSATFNLGVIQALAKHDLLDKFDYLSTVSGGGYIGSWLTAWLSRNSGRRAESLRELGDSANTPRTAKFEPIDWLRRFTQYLAPKEGLLSPDTWTIISAYLRNLFLNWLVLIPTCACLLLIHRGLLLYTKTPSADLGEYLLIASTIAGMATVGFTAAFLPIQRRYLAEFYSKGPSAFMVGVLIFFPLILAAVALTLGWASIASQSSSILDGWKNSIFCFLKLDNSGINVSSPLAFSLLYGLLFNIGGFTLKELLTALVATICFLMSEHPTARPLTLWNWLCQILVPSCVIAVACISLWMTASNYLLLIGAGILLPLSTFWLRDGIRKKKETDSNPYWLVKLKNGCKFLLGELGWLFAGLPPGFLLWIAIQFLWPAPSKHPTLYLIFSLPYALLSYWIGVSVMTGLQSKKTKDDDREWWARLGGWMLLFATGWIVIGATAFYGPEILSIAPKTLLGFLVTIASLYLAFGSSTTANIEDPKTNPWREKLRAFTPKLTAPILLLFLLLILSLAISIVLNLPSWILRERSVTIGGPNYWNPWASQLTINLPQVQHLAGCSPTLLRKDGLAGCTEQLANLHKASLGSTTWDVFWIVLSITIAIAMIMNMCVGVNRFSLHAIYRDRLRTAYLAASNNARKPDRFTDHDPHDDVKLCDLKAVRPLHILNAALNLAKTDNLAWQERKAQSFTMSALHCGSSNLGEHGSYLTTPDKVKLSSAMAISGAAANPNMGRHSSGPVTALLAIFNLRLGWWAGNPNCGTPAYQQPKMWLFPYLRELTGRTDDKWKYVNLSDGGHFENLGLYEMVLRGCKRIVVCDAEEDPDYTFNGLAIALRHISVDLGIKITIDLNQIRMNAQKKRTAYFTQGTIHYNSEDLKDAQNGKIFYIKASLKGTEPEDILKYSKVHLTFPHESTSNQFFTESQFESYRHLGFAIGENCSGPLADFFTPGKFKIHDRVILKTDLKNTKLKTNDVGTVTSIDPTSDTYTVTFHTLDGKTTITKTISSNSFRHPDEGEMPQARSKL